MPRLWRRIAGHRIPEITRDQLRCVQWQGGGGDFSDFAGDGLKGAAGGEDEDAAGEFELRGEEVDEGEFVVGIAEAVPGAMDFEAEEEETLFGEVLELFLGEPCVDDFGTAAQEGGQVGEF